MKFGEICVHKQLKRKCYTCELEEQIKDFELMIQGAINLLASSGHSCHSRACMCKSVAAMDIEKEFQRIKNSQFKK